MFRKLSGMTGEDKAPLTLGTPLARSAVHVHLVGNARGWRRGLWAPPSFSERRERRLPCQKQSGQDRQPGLGGGVAGFYSGPARTWGGRHKAWTLAGWVASPDEAPLCNGLLHRGAGLAPGFPSFVSSLGCVSYGHGRPAQFSPPPPPHAPL